jgi:hypothetical protein
MVLENVPFLVKFQKIHFLGKILAKIVWIW